MKQVVVAAAIAAASLPLQAQDNLTWVDFVEAVIYVESRGNECAHNVEEDAVGCLQIRPIMVREVNRILARNNNPMRFTLEDRWDREKSVYMFDIIADQVPCCEDVSFLEYTEHVARVWNGGTRGHLKCSTTTYWEKVKAKMLE